MGALLDDSSIQKVLQEIILSESFEKSASDLSHEERELVAQMLVMRAEEKLLGETMMDAIMGAKKSLTIATDLAPLSAEVWYQKGLVLAAQDVKEDTQEAIACFRKALSFHDKRLDDPELDIAGHVDIKYALATCLTRLGIFDDEGEYFHEADLQYKEIAARPQFPTRQDEAEFYWNWGILCSIIAKGSGEASDLNAAIQRFRTAQALGLSSADFCADFANTLIQFATLVNREEHLFEAIDLYKSTLPLDIERIDEEQTEEMAQRFFHFGCAYAYLFSSKLDEGYFNAASEAFQKAVKLDQGFMPAWTQWGAILLLASKLWQNADCLHASVIKLREAYRLSPTASVVMVSFGEALAYLGMHEENVDFIKQAETLVQQSIQNEPEYVDLYATHAAILCHFACYFSEKKYVVQALEQIAQGLAIDENYGPLYYRLALAKYLLAELTDDVVVLEEALDAFQMASKTDVGRFGYFWNEWGLSLLSIASITLDKKYLHEAQEKFERAITISTKVLPEWLYNYGCTLTYLGDVAENESYYERALQAFTNAITLDPTFLSARFHLARCYCHLGVLMDDVESFQEAARQFQIVIEQDPEDDLTWIEWGVTLMHLTELTHDETLKQDNTWLDVAEMNFLQALMLGNDEASYYLASLYSYQGNISDAIYYFEKALENEALPPLEAIMEDDWLDNLRKTAHFKDLVQALREDEL